MDERDRKRRQAKRDLERLSKQGGLLNTPTMPHKAKSLKGHFMADDADQSDSMELWGTRIARALSLIAFIFLLFWVLS